MPDPEPRPIAAYYITRQILIDRINREVTVDGVTFAWAAGSEPQIAHMTIPGWPLPVPIVLNVGARLPQGPASITPPTEGDPEDA